MDCFKVGHNITSSTATISSRSVLVNQFISLEDSPRSLCCANISAITSCDGKTLVGFPYVLCGTTTDVIPYPVVDLKANTGSVGVNSFVVSWQRPTNYDSPGLRYKITISDGQEHLIGEQFFFAGNLQPCTNYMVNVYAVNTVSMLGEASNISVRTEPALPPSPTNLSFSFSNYSGILSLTWNKLETSCNTQTIDYYRVMWRCDGASSQTNYTTNNTIVVLTRSVDFGLCTATVQSCDNSNRCSSFSDQVVIETTSLPPPTLECYYFAELNNDVKAAFLFPSPFITSGLQIYWNLTNINEDLHNLSSYAYTASSTNVVDLPTESDTQYIFTIFACNVFGCGNACLLNFTTSVSCVGNLNIVVSDERINSYKNMGI